MNLTELLDKAAGSLPEKAAIIDGAETISYAGLVEKIAGFAAKLEQFGLPAGCRVGLCYPNSINYIALTYALWRIRAVVVPIPAEGADVEFSSIASTLQLAAVLSQTSRDGAAAMSEGFFTRLAPPSPPDNHGLNVAFIRFTSGTTNARKGVVLTHETIRDRVTAANKALRIGPDDTVMWCLPMSHHFLITIVLYLSHGATIVLARHVLARPFLEAVNRWQGTVLYAAPFHYGMLARDNSELEMKSVRLAVSTTCALPQTVGEDFSKRFGFPLTQGLGVIEMGLVSLNMDASQARWDSVGHPLPDCHVRIVAPDENGCGEVEICGPGMFDAYAAPWVPRESVLHDGWFKTGDIGRLDAEGYLYLVGRKIGVINLAGRKVFPEEIEAVLNRHPAVRESRAFGRLHPHLGEVVEADVVLSHPEADLDAVRAHCRANLASFKIPSRLNVVTTLPRTAVTGKIRRVGAVA